MFTRACKTPAALATVCVKALLCVALKTAIFVLFRRIVARMFFVYLHMLPARHRQLRTDVDLGLNEVVLEGHCMHAEALMEG
jgi:hypothetical protein